MLGDASDRISRNTSHDRVFRSSWEKLRWWIARAFQAFYGLCITITVTDWTTNLLIGVLTGLAYVPFAPFAEFLASRLGTSLYRPGTAEAVMSIPTTSTRTRRLAP
ncbi:hypothetical protein [Actinocrispum wychmicini]|uniref:Uncharacterized protein n=1 Tax=Actinocrispum wychmicini TaxID=1213861 RepID=A0A4R2JN32_9PSEU|nr:hypothetical protein [Actinocrispum wychmicini]TCO55585.1 hypothetical protein EV192_1076 [Actinocrispum wychmicini]